MRVSERQFITHVYREFYRKTPIYLEENIRNLNIEFQAMFQILDYSGAFSKYQFEYIGLNEYKMPFAKDLNNLIMDIIKDGGNVQECIINWNPIKLARINLIGDIINDALSEVPNRYVALENIASILYAKRNLLPTSLDEDIANYSGKDIEDVAKVRTLFEKIRRNVI